MTTRINKNRATKLPPSIITPQQLEEYLTPTASPTPQRPQRNKPIERLGFIDSSNWDFEQQLRMPPKKIIAKHTPEPAAAAASSSSSYNPLQGTLASLISDNVFPRPTSSTVEHTNIAHPTVSEDEDEDIIEPEEEVFETEDDAHLLESFVNDQIQHNNPPARTPSASSSQHTMPTRSSNNRRPSSATAAASSQPTTSPSKQQRVAWKNEHNASFLTTIADWAYENGIVPPQSRTGADAAANIQWKGVAEQMLKSDIKSIFKSMDVAHVAKSCSTKYTNLKLTIKVSQHTHMRSSKLYVISLTRVCFCSHQNSAPDKLAKWKQAITTLEYTKARDLNLNLGDEEATEQARRQHATTQAEAIMQNITIDESNQHTYISWAPEYRQPAAIEAAWQML